MQNRSNEGESPSPPRRPVPFWLCVLAVAAVALLGGLATQASLETWFRELKKPIFQPPDWLFGPVWSVLYAMMGVAAWLVGRERAAEFDPPDRGSELGGGAPGKGALTARQQRIDWFLVAFAVQLLLNLGWSVLFFGLRSPGVAFVDICLLWLAIALTLRLAFPIRPVAGWLLVPYLAWVTFAAVLNFRIWMLNS